jgi:hypothetical protein
LLERRCAALRLFAASPLQQGVRRCHEAEN